MVRLAVKLKEKKKRKGMQKSREQLQPLLSGRCHHCQRVSGQETVTMDTFPVVQKHLKEWSGVPASTVVGQGAVAAKHFRANLSNVTQMRVFRQSP